MQGVENKLHKTQSMNHQIYDVAVIGAGISGLATARRLQHGGKSVVVLEGSTAMGGRAATCRVIGSTEFEVSVDHGAQSFTAHDASFVEQVERWADAGICFPWTEGLWKWSRGALREPEKHERTTHYACRDGMNQLGISLADGLEVILEYKVARVDKVMGIWHIHAVQNHTTPLPFQARTLFVSIPLPGAIKLLGAKLFRLEDRELTGRISYEPTTTVVAIYPEWIKHPPWSGIQLHDQNSSIFRITWDSSRRKKGSHGAVAVIHAKEPMGSRTTELSEEGLRKEGEQLLEAAGQYAGEWMQNPVSIAVHRWRYGRSVGPRAERGFLKVQESPRVYVVGDGLNGGLIEGAWLSGTFAAEDFLRKTQPETQPYGRSNKSCLLIGKRKL